MARTSNVFTDPAGLLATYVWAVNHDEESEQGKTRAVEHTGNTGTTGLVRQQGDDEPLVLRFSGTMLQETQVIATLRYFQACRTRSVRFTDFNGDGYEVLITSFKPLRQRVLRNDRDLSRAPLHIWKYQIEMEVLTILSGPYATAGVTP